MTSGMTDQEKGRYLSSSRHNRNLSKFGPLEMARRKKERMIREKWGPPKEPRVKVLKEDKRKGVHGLRARKEREAMTMMPERRMGGGGGGGEGESGGSFGL